MKNKLKLKKGDEVIVITGKDKGKKGPILKVLTEERRVIVGGVNVLTHFNKPSRAGAGGMEKKESPVHVSNVALADPKTGKPSRVGYKILADGKKVRVAKKSKEVLNG